MHHKKTVSELINSIKDKNVSVQEITEFFLGRIKQNDSHLTAFMEVFEEDALLKAKEIDKKIKSGQKVGLLAGLPIAIKDNMCIKGKKTTCSSKILENYISPYNATVIEKLEQEDAVIIGKTNMDEFAMGSSTENSAYKVTKNPWNKNYIPGGSSGGSAVAVSAGLSALALGSDTGGSIRQPASCCGVVGLKPTYGSVSRYGLIAFGSSLDQIGTFSKCVADSALLLQVISGYDRKDSTSANISVPDYTELINSRKDLKGLKIGLPKEYFISGIDQDVSKAMKDAIKALEKLGAVILDISLPHTEYAVAVYYILAPSEASANLARFDSVKYGYREQNTSGLLETYKKSRGKGFGSEVKRRIMLGTYALSAGYYDAYYGKAQKVRTLIKRDFEEAFKKVDAIVTPTAPSAAFKIGERTDDPLQMYLSDIFTIPCNLAGLPGISIPCGFTKDNLPVGLQILGRHFDEKTILEIGHNYEQSTDWHLKYPGV
ncbi:MAG: Asp-tRNA(Asn)/Glu-tRNA(Gln) amidotransferase subunit GatA [Elusimicrobia bacterium]|nr:Asp-tRNA(Asn)/Glu-tRNA(Gln) amidotransferase subunit GatA [Elusimicrobiota bacterium]MBU2614987.1 Asp-tRNA(Asn)/Glu-tRNA(Gln) amidotransferase subunit GatA [Elusimicrobiota bacterium]